MDGFADGFDDGAKTETLDVSPVGLSVGDRLGNRVGASDVDGVASCGAVGAKLRKRGESVVGVSVNSAVGAVLYFAVGPKLSILDGESVVSFVGQTDGSWLRSSVGFVLG